VCISLCTTLTQNSIEQFWLFSFLTSRQSSQLDVVLWRRGRVYCSVALQSARLQQHFSASDSPATYDAIQIYIWFDLIWKVQVQTTISYHVDSPIDVWPRTKDDRRWMLTRNARMWLWRRSMWSAQNIMACHS